MFRAFSIVCCLGLIVWCTAPQAAAAPVDTGSEAAYAACLDAIIAHCETKARLSVSRFPALRLAAARYCLKADFVRAHHRQLLKDLRAAAVAPKAYRVEFFVNHRFHSELAAATRNLYAAHPTLSLEKERHHEKN